MRKKLFRLGKEYLSFLKEIISIKIDKKIATILYLSLCFPLFVMLIDIISENYKIPWLQTLQTYLTLKNPLVYPFIIASSIIFFGLLFAILSFAVYINKDNFFKEEPKFKKDLKFEEIYKKLFLKRFGGNANSIVKFYSMSVIIYYVFLLSYSSLYNLKIELAHINIWEAYVIFVFIFSALTLILLFHFHYCILLPFQNNFIIKYIVALTLSILLIFTSPPILHIYPMINKITTMGMVRNSLSLILPIVAALVSAYLVEKRRYKLTKSPDNYPFKSFSYYGFYAFFNIFPVWMFIFMLSLVTSNVMFSANAFNLPKILDSLTFLFFIATYPLIVTIISVTIMHKYSSKIVDTLWQWRVYFGFSEIDESENKFNTPMVKRTGICIAHSYDPQFLNIGRCQEHILLLKEKGDEVIKISVLKLEIDNHFRDSYTKKILEGDKITVFGRPRLFFDKQLEIKPMIEAFNVEYASEQKERNIYSITNKRDKIMEKLKITEF